MARIKRKATTPIARPAIAPPESLCVELDAGDEVVSVVGDDVAGSLMRVEESFFVAVAAFDADIDASSAANMDTMAESDVAHLIKMPAAKTVVLVAVKCFCPAS